MAVYNDCGKMRDIFFPHFKFWEGAYPCDTRSLCLRVIGVLLLQLLMLDGEY